MTYLLDINVLIALVDSAHVNHGAAHAWFGVARDWATCPLTQNAFVRILSSPAYPDVEATPAQVVEYLRQMMSHPRHTAIADDVSLADAALFDARLLGSSREVTDAYLLGLAHRHGFKLATLDRRLRRGAVVGASGASIELIPA